MKTEPKPADYWVGEIITVPLNLVTCVTLVDSVLAVLCGIADCLL